MSRQLPLVWPAPAQYRFDHFDGTGNETALSLLQARAEGSDDDQPLLLVGGPGVGKTHLLVATASAAREHGLACAYLALSRWAEFDAHALSALAGQHLLLIDEVDAIVGRRDTEIALFDLYNRCRDRHCRLVLAARALPARLPVVLPDLASRLHAATLAVVDPLPEANRKALLQARAHARGFELDDGVLDFLFRRHRRDLGALMDLIERLDSESLARQRRVTVPLVRSVLETTSDPN